MAQAPVHRDCFLEVCGGSAGSITHMGDEIVDYAGKFYKSTLRGVGFNRLIWKNWNFDELNALQVIGTAF